MRYAITPTPKPRMTQSDRWKKRHCVLRYRAFCDQVRASAVHLPEYGASITFCLPMPRSWSKMKKEAFDGAPHTSRPDLSNLLKALEDAVYDDDSKIWNYQRITKIWGYEGFIEIIDATLPNLSM